SCAARGVMNAATTHGTGVMNAAATNTPSFQSDPSNLVFLFIMTPVQWLPYHPDESANRGSQWTGVMNAAATKLCS
ncbi:MAG: hypothetical protein M3Z24_00190, partial [Chloroflexota bacterium]|nr:hypothetical protein [Chloroflexota bacterium]